MADRLLEILYIALENYSNEEFMDAEDEAIVRRYMRKLENTVPGIQKTAGHHRRLMKEIALQFADADMSPGRPSWLS